MRVLIVSPHFPPVNAADMQRVRLVLPYLAESGVSVEVLAVEPEQVAAPRDEWLVAGLPDGVLVHRVKAMGLGFGKILGLGTLTFRALRALGRKGDELLGENGQSRKRFDLIYFSTTEFGLHVLGPRWKRKCGVPFVMDYQDPWVSDYYREHSEIIPPGGRLKYGVASWLARRQEPRVLRECAGITSVSAAYPEQLAKRYGWLGGMPHAVLPFPGDERDFERVKAENIRQSVFDPDGGKQHWVYVGVCPPSMMFSIRALFEALHQLKSAQPGLFDTLTLHFVGTSYAPAGTAEKVVEPLAAQFGPQAQVCELTDRIPYSQALRCLLDADLLLVPGTDDPGYTASKIYPYLLAERPLLAVFHEQSSVCGLMRRVGGGHVVSFSSGETPGEVAERISRVPGLAELSLPRVPHNREAFEPHTAKAQARELTSFFRQVLIRSTR